MKPVANPERPGQVEATPAALALLAEAALPWPTVLLYNPSASAPRGWYLRRPVRDLRPGVLVLAALVALIGSLLGDPELWITRALVVLVAASPCALAIAVPVTVVSAIGAATKFGVVIKSGAAFERLGGIRQREIDAGMFLRQLLGQQLLELEPVPGGMVVFVQLIPRMIRDR